MPPGGIAQVQQDQSAPDVCPWPIGALVAAHWVAHRSGMQPDGLAVIEATDLGLIDLGGGEWSVTESGRSALREHGWL
jgi:hypothetical protein